LPKKQPVEERPPESDLDVSEGVVSDLPSGIRRGVSYLPDNDSGSENDNLPAVEEGRVPTEEEQRAIQRWIDQQRRFGKNVQTRGSNIVVNERVYRARIDLAKRIEDQIRFCQELFAQALYQQAIVNVLLLVHMTPTSLKDEAFDSDMKAANEIINVEAGYDSVDAGMVFKKQKIFNPFKALQACIDLWMRRGIVWNEGQSSTFY